GCFARESGHDVLTERRATPRRQGAASLRSERPPLNPSAAAGKELPTAAKQAKRDPPASGRRGISARLCGTFPAGPRMRIISFNANGIRSASNKGFFDWLAGQQADVVCLQETKAQEHQLADPCFRPMGHCVYRDAVTKKGYSGVAIYSRREPDEVRTELGWAPFDDEGRYIEARFGNLSVVSFYIPSGSSGELRQGFKFEVMDWLKPILDQWLASGREYVLCGDWNIVRSRNDIRNW